LPKSLPLTRHGILDRRKSDQWVGGHRMPVVPDLRSNRGALPPAYGPPRDICDPKRLAKEPGPRRWAKKSALEVGHRRWLLLLGKMLRGFDPKMLRLRHSFG